MYKSTRSNTYVHSSEAIIKGISSDGGLFVFNDVNPSFFNQNLLSLTYKELSVQVLKVLLTDYSDDEIKEIVSRSYHDNFIESVVDLYDENNRSFLELFHGNTFAFKDLALSMLPHLFNVAKKKHNIKKKTVILTATSGDTGGAALSGFSQLEDTSVIVLYPKQGVSEFQELQMNQFQSKEHIVIGIDGNFDDCQRIVKDVFVNESFDHVLLSSANSINIGRIIPQVVYYVYSYCELVRRKNIQYGDFINVTVPTGNFGNIYAAYVAKRLGVPIQTLLIASNENNVLTDLFNTGLYNTDRTLKPSISPSMDILVSSNVERYLFDVFGSDFVNQSMNELKETGKTVVKEINSNNLFYASFAFESDIKKEIQRVYQQSGYVMDPHTAVASFVSETYRKETQDDTYMLVVSTASPYKFSQAVLEGLGDKVKSLQDGINTLETWIQKPCDSRIRKVLESTLKPIVLSKESAYEYIKKVVGDCHD